MNAFRCEKMKGGLNMAQNYNYYAIIGNNGYGLSSDWSDIASNAKLLQNEWHRGFQTEEEAYSWLIEQVGIFPTTRLAITRLPPALS